MGLQYTISYTLIVDDKEVSNQFVKLVDSAIVLDNTKYISVEEYIIQNKPSIALMVRNYSRIYTSV
jgi:hypothetical protein